MSVKKSAFTRLSFWQILRINHVKNQLHFAILDIVMINPSVLLFEQNSVSTGTWQTLHGFRNMFFPEWKHVSF
jgi:hypothetical protein